jgi:hypothetical protein
LASFHSTIPHFLLNTRLPHSLYRRNADIIINNILSYLHSSSISVKKTCQSETTQNQIPFEGCDKYQEWIIEGVYTVMLVKDHTLEQHQEIIDVPNLNKYIEHRFHRNTGNVDMYTTHKINDGLLKAIWSDRGVWHIKLRKQLG